MTYTVRFGPEARGHLISIERYIADASSPVVAAQYVEAIVTYCGGLATFPNRGRRRDDLMPGLRITNFRDRVIIAFLVDADAEIVLIVDVFYGGQDYETRLL